MPVLRLRVLGSTRSSPTSRSCSSAARSPIAASGRAGTRPSTTSMSGMDAERHVAARRSAACPPRSRATATPAIAGWVPGYSDTDRAADLQARANSASAVLWSAGIGSADGGLSFPGRLWYRHVDDAQNRQTSDSIRVVAQLVGPARVVPILQSSAAFCSASRPRRDGPILGRLPCDSRMSSPVSATGRRSRATKSICSSAASSTAACPTIRRPRC